MTEKEEIAVALLLYRNYRCHLEKILCGNINKTLVDNKTEDITFHVGRVARRLGVHDEYYAMLLKFPVMSIKVKELDEWDVENPCVDSRIDTRSSIAGRKGALKRKENLAKQRNGKSEPQPKPKKSSKQLP